MPFGLTVSPGPTVWSKSPRKLISSVNRKGDSEGGSVTAMGVVGVNAMGKSYFYRGNLWLGGERIFHLSSPKTFRIALGESPILFGICSWAMTNVKSQMTNGKSIPSLNLELEIGRARLNSS